MTRRFLWIIIFLPLELSACAKAPPPAPPKPTAPPALPADPLENAVLDSRGQVLQKAKDVQKQVEDQAAEQRKAIEDEGG